MTYQEFLEAHAGDPVKAAEAYAAYKAASAAGANQAPANQDQPRADRAQDARNRITLRALTTALRQHGLELPDHEGVSQERWNEQLTTAVGAFASSLTAASTASTELSAAMGELGIDMDAWNRAGKDRRAEMISAAKSATSGAAQELAKLKREVTVKETAAELGVDPKRLSFLLQGREITRTETEADGKKTVSYTVGTGDSAVSLDQVVSDAGFGTLEEFAGKAAEKKTEEANTDPFAFLESGQSSKTNEGSTSTDPLAFLDAK